MITAPITAAKDVPTFFRTAPKTETTAKTTEAETLTAEEVAALIEDAPAPSPCAFVPTDAGGVDWVLKKISAARAEAKLIRENMEAMARACERRAEALEWKYGGPIQSYLRAELAESKGSSKSKRLPHGVIGYRTKPAGVSVTDPAAALSWARENLPEAVTEALDKKALADALLATGEALPFAAFQPAEEVFYIK
jgi:phage host-nuclease inhibitor protein Gam